MKGTGYSIRRSNPADAAAVARLMNLAFGTEARATTSDEAWWHWKYGQNPNGYHGLVAQDAEGRVVGHYGGVPVVVRVDGERMLFGQNCDSCSDPSVRRGLRNPGMFVRLAQAYASTFAVPGVDAVMYGLPNREVYRVGSRYLDYWMLRQQWLLVASGAESGVDDAAFDVVDVERFGDDADRLFDRVANDERCIAERNARFLNWRFLDAPDGHYRATAVRHRADERLVAYAVHRRAHLMGVDVAIIVDWLCERDALAAGAMLVDGVRQLHAECGIATTVFLCPTSSSWFGVFQDWGFAVTTSEYMMTARPYDTRLEPAFLREHWYYTCADFDIV